MFPPSENHTGTKILIFRCLSIIRTGKTILLLTILFEALQDKAELILFLIDNGAEKIQDGLFPLMLGCFL